jgi:glycosyltransferase involved in cell wall biosynthesis
MRITHVITGLMTGGAETMLFKLAESSQRAGWSFSVVSVTGLGTFGERFERLGVPVCALGLDRKNVLALPRLRRAIRDFRPQLIQGWMTHGNLAASLASMMARPRVPVLWNVRGTLVLEKSTTAWATRLGARFSGSVARIIYNADDAVRQHETLGFRPDRRVVIPNGFDLSRFRFDGDVRRETRRRLQLRDDECAIALVARYHPVKDHRTFLAAIAQLRDRGLPVRAVLAGRGVTADNVELREIVQAFRLSSSVLLLDEVSDIPGLLNGMDIACLCSLAEGFPNVLGEAMACEVPCVATEVGAAREILGDRRRLVPAGQPTELAEALASLVSAGPAGRRAAGASSREHIRRNFSIDSIVDQYRQVYQGVLHEAHDSLALAL